MSIVAGRLLANVFGSNARRYFVNRRSIGMLLAAAAGWACASLAFAQAFPAKPIRMVVALAGGSEGFARLVAQKLSDGDLATVAKIVKSAGIRPE